MKRRTLFKAAAGTVLLMAGAGGALFLGVSPPTARERLGKAGAGALNGWVRVGPDGRVGVVVPRAEMGQGVNSALCLLVAEELDADWSQVHAEAAPVDKIYANGAVLLNILPVAMNDQGFMAHRLRAIGQTLGSAVGLQITGGSASVRDAWEPLRLAGACARAQLVAAAAQAWGVPAGEISVVRGVLSHASGKKGGFGDFAAAAAQIQPPAQVKLKAPQDWVFIGKGAPRIDLPAKVNGRAVFGIDVRPEGLLYAAIAQCPVLGGTLKGFKPPELPAGSKVQALGTRAVVAISSNTWKAQQLLNQTTIEWQGGHDKLNTQQLREQLIKVLDEQRGFAFRNDGDAAGQLAQGEVISARYEVPFLAHAAMEPINCTAQFKDGKLTVWCSTQVQSFAQQAAARLAGVPLDAVTLHVPYLGGGFGRRLEFDMVEQAVAIALTTEGRPVKLTWSRDEDTQHDFYRPMAMADFKARLGPDGKPLAWFNQVAAPSLGLDTMKRVFPKFAMDSPDKNHIEGAFELPYALPNISVRQLRSEMPVPVGSWRSVGHSYNAFFTECFLDELAAAAKQEPLAYRLSLLEGAPRHKAVLLAAATKAGWQPSSGWPPLPEGQARGVALHESFGSICAQVAEVSLQGNEVRVHRVVAALDCGIAVDPLNVDAQLQSAIVYGLSAALYGEITVAEGRVQQGNFPSYDAIKMASMPRIETVIVASSEPPGGVGEPGTPPIGPAVANAISQITGWRIRQLPIRL